MVKCTQKGGGAIFLSYINHMIVCSVDSDETSKEIDLIALYFSYWLSYDERLDITI